MPRIKQVVPPRDVIPRSAKKRNLALEKEKQNDSEYEREISQEDLEEERDDSELDLKQEVDDEEISSNPKKRSRQDPDEEEEEEENVTEVRIHPFTGKVVIKEKPNKECDRQAMEEEDPNSESFDNFDMSTENESELSSNQVMATCGHLSGILHKDKFLCPGIHSECIELSDHTMVTPKTFSILGGKQSLKDWKNAVRIDGMCIRKLMDVGGLDFANHRNHCTGKCVSRHPGISKYDTKMFLEEGTNGLPTFVPLVNSVGKEQAYQVLRDAIGENSLNQPVFPGQMESSVFPAGVVIKREITSDNEEDSTDGEPSRSNKKMKIGSSLLAAQNKGAAAMPDKDTMQLVNDLPSFDEMVEDSQTFWKGILEIGMVDTFFKEMKKSLDVLKNDMISYGCREDDAKKCSELVSNLGLMTRLKWKLAVHKTETEKQKEKLRMEIEALKRKVAESEEKTKELDRKSDCFVQLLDIGKTKPKLNSSVSNSPSTPRPETPKEVSNGSEKANSSEAEN